MAVNNRDDDDAIDEFHLDAIADADPYPYWYDDADEPDSNPTLVRTETCDLCIIGGGYTGLWTAIIAKERDPSRDVVLIDAHEIGSAASGRNGGFMESSLTHGVANGQERFPHELPLLEELGLQNLNEIEAAIKRYNIDCDYERPGVIDVATSSHSPSYVDELREDYQQLRALGQKVEWLDATAMQSQVNSATYTGGLWRKDRAAIVDPARLVWGLKSAAMSLGVRIYEDTKATSLDKDGVGVLITTPLGRVRAGNVSVANGICATVCAISVGGSVERGRASGYGIQKYLDGYEISPHPDVRAKALTYMININPSPTSFEDEHHMSFLSFKPEWNYVREFWQGNDNYDRCWVPWDWCDIKKQQRNNNSIVIFSPDNDTIHAVKANFNHLKYQRTQIYGNLWYRQPQRMAKPKWEDFLIGTRPSSSLVETNTPQPLEALKKLMPAKVVSAVKKIINR